jgi:peptidoglycan biosynthesis protein MviN/MurJ (putative lipid II flippase)
MPVVFLVFAYSEEIITIVFKRGAFEQTSVRLCAGFLKYFIFVIPFMAIYTLMARINMATGKIKQAAAYETVTNLFLIAAIVWALGRFGAVGYPAALAAGFLILTLPGLYLYNKIIFPWLRFGRVIKYVIAIFAVNFAVAFVMIKAKPYLFTNPILNLSTGTIFYLITITVLSFILNLNKDFNLYLKTAYKKIFKT